MAASSQWQLGPAAESVQRLQRIPSTHPSLHFTTGELQLMKKNASGTHQRYAEQLYRWVDSHSEWSPPIMEGGAGSEVALEETGAFLTNAGLAWVLSGKKRHFELARSWSLAVCSQRVETLRSYGRGVLAAGLARSYDWLYRDLPRSDRTAIRSKLELLLAGLYQAAQPATQETEWWAQLPLHHDHWIPVGGLGEAALALLGEVDAASEWAAWARADFDAILALLGDDGAWHEGAADWVYAMAPLLWFFSAWESVTNENLHNTPWIRNTAAFRLYHWLPDNTYVYLDDSFRSGRYNTSGSASCHLLRRLAALFQNQQSQWLAEQDERFDLDPETKGVFKAPFENFSFRKHTIEYGKRASQSVAWNFLWYDPQLPAEAPEAAPNIRHFENQEIVVLRTGWKSDSSVVSLTCGPLAGQRAADHIRSGNRLDQGNSHHSHADYGAFTIFACGQYFVVPPGYARRSSGFQNVVSVNGTDYRTRQDLNIRVLGTHSDSSYSYAVADATNAFHGSLGIQSYRRHLLLLHEGLLIIFDDLTLKRPQTSQSYNRFEWNVHIDPSTHSLRLEGKKVEWLDLSGAPTPMRLEILCPIGFAWERRVLQSTEGDPLLTALTLQRPEWYEEKMQVLALFSWTSSRSVPKAILQDGVWGVAWAEFPQRPAIVFTAGKPDAQELVGIAENSQEVILFGTQSPPEIIRLRN